MTRMRINSAAGGPGDGPRWPPHEPPARTLVLQSSECWRLIGGTGVAHLAIRADPVGVDMFPIDYLVRDRILYFRSGAGTKLRELASEPFVAMIVDGTAEKGRFSVVVKGRAERLAYDEEIVGSGVMDIVPTEGGEKFNYVRVTPSAITGRLFTS